MGLLGAPTYPMLRDATQATLFEILDSNDIPYEHNKAENMLVLRDTRSKIIFRAVDEFERLRGSNLAWFGLDELTYTQEEAWLRLEGRLRDPKATRLCGFAVWTPKGYDWVYRKFITNRAKNYAAILAKPFENKHLTDRIPDYYRRLEESYDPKFYAQEVLGEYLSQDGSRIYSSFERAEHVKQLRVDPHLPLLWALDFNVDPMSSVIAQISHGTVSVLDEIVIRRGTTREACEEFLKRHPRHDAEVLVYGDASGHAQQTTGASDYDMVKEYFEAYSTLTVRYRAPRSNPPVRERLNLLNSRLRSAAGDVSLYVDEQCKELIKDFEQVCYTADGEQIDKGRDKLRTHLSDALGYLVWQECRPTGTIGEQPRRIV
jgi:hypothetical protein